MPAKKKYSSTIDLYVRFPADLHALIKEIAEEENRSLNAQVITLVQEAIAARRALKPGSPTLPGP